MVDNRTEYIKFGIDNNVPPEGINNALSQYGMAPLSKTELMEINDGTFGMNVGQRFIEGVKDLGGGLATIGGMAGQALRDPDLRNEIVNNVQNYVSTHSTGDMVMDVGNALLNPYNELNVQKALTQNPVETFTDITSGIEARPFNAALDAFGLTGPAISGLAKTKTGSKLIEKGIEALDNTKIPKQIKSLIPGTKEAKINDILNTSRYAPAETIESLDNLNSTIKQAKTEDLSKAIKNLEEGILDGTKEQIELTNTLKNLSKSTDDILVKYGLDPYLVRKNAYSQYITRKLQGQNIDIPTKKVQDYLDGKIDNIEGVTKETLDKLYLEGKDLYDKGLIYPVRHNTTETMTREGLLDEAIKQTTDKYSKLYGTQTYDDLSKTLKEKGYDSTLNKFNRVEQTSNAVDEIANTVAQKIDNIDDIKLLDDEVIISPRLLKEKFGTSLIQGTSIADDIKSLSRGLNKDEIKAYADDIYKISKDDLKAIERAYTPSGTGVDKLVSMAKRSTLATPRYMIGNATTNIGMNLTEGVTPLHYASALVNKDLIPKSLKRSTTFSGYLGKEARTNTSINDIYNNLFNKLKNGTPTEKLEAIQEITTTPFFKSAGNAELLDRSANYIKQAERYAQETKRDINDVLKDSLKNNGNNKTYRTLLNRVNNALGDYSGINNYANQNITKFANMLTPFYRPYTQGLRQLGHQTFNNPIPNLVVNRIPASIGNDITRYAEQELNVTPDEDRSGGYPLLPRFGKMPSRVIYNPYHAYSAVGELASNPTDVLKGNLMGLAPILGLSGKNRYLQDARLPNQIDINGRKVQLDNNGNKVNTSIIDRLQLAGVQSAQAYIAPINQINSILLPTLAALTDSEYRKPYDNSLFGTINNIKIPGIMNSDEASRPIKGENNLLPLMGFYETDTYPKRKGVSPRELRQDRRNKNRKTQINRREY